METGLQDGFAGEKTFRIDHDEMIVVNMVRSDDGRCRTTAKGMSRLSVFHFEPAKVLVIPTPGGSISLMERGSAAETGVVNWFSDAQYVEQIVQAALAAESEEARATAAVASTLLAHADKLAGRLSGGGEPDPRDGGRRPPMLSLSKRAFTPVFDRRRAERKVSAPHPPCMTLLSHGSPV